MSEKDSTIKSEGKSKLAKWGAIAAGLLVVFLLGLVPMLIQKWAVQKELATTQTQLRKVEIKGLLTTSIVEAKRGEYEPARQNMSSFFQRLRAEEEKADEGFLTKDERGKIKPIFEARDTIITMLAQRDQASVERLTDIYATYQQAMGIPQPPTTAPPSETPADNKPEKPTEQNTETPTQ
jgi:hypothetical protein